MTSDYNRCGPTCDCDRTDCAWMLRRAAERSFPRNDPENDGWTVYYPSMDGAPPSSLANTPSSRWEVQCRGRDSCEPWAVTFNPGWYVECAYRYRPRPGMGHNGGPPLDSPQPTLPENPKAIYGRAKPSLGLIPGAASVAESRVYALGAEKYGFFNWRKDPVESMTYVHAGLRHLMSWVDGEETDPESGESHLAHARACLGILLDAQACGTLIDDRPVKGVTASEIAKKTKPVNTCE